MSSIDELAIVSQISSLPELAGRLTAVQTYCKIGCMIDIYAYSIFLDGQEIGHFYINDAVTFFAAGYRGKDPTNPDNYVEKDSSRIRSLSEFKREKFEEGVRIIMEDKARRQLGQHGTCNSS